MSIGKWIKVEYKIRKQQTENKKEFKLNLNHVEISLTRMHKNQVQSPSHPHHLIIMVLRVS